ncbi:patatin-like phospholipase family protein [Extensimonas vulgaris]|jgi:NTE family protein|uniref:NTE family protein n=1 Tax=Extensimonas vulgaris TaxID=1031594 RepID=A0A369AG58_9BURK|nr:patatin-like phospholipase family protein [Extensimonas vulgaris]RCX07338.1 NTE family protein [Extensimonas vulgaris]TWI34691.1 NTE family protein [Extensimonas vulgaris]TXD12806.1 patatin [Extensimonas vulgaris]
MPPPEPASTFHATPPRVGVALGSGSARGLAHIGVLRALQEAGIAVDCVAGTSMGAVVGAVYASGKIERMAERLRNLDWAGIVALLDPVFPRSGLIDGQRVAEFVRAHVPGALIEDLALPFAAVATDWETGAEVVARSGELTEAVRASIAVPGIVTPVRSNGRLLVDGGLVNPVPVSVARALGAEVVIAVDLNHDIVSGRRNRVAAKGRGVNGNGTNGSGVNGNGAASAGMAGGNGEGNGGHGKTSGTALTPILTRLLDSLRAKESPMFAQISSWLRRTPQEPLPSIFEVLLGSLYIMQARITEASLQQDPPDILIQPPLGAVRFMEFDRIEEIIDIGWRSAREQLAAQWPAVAARARQ